MLQVGQPGRGGPTALATQVGLGDREVAHPAQHVVQLVGAAGAAAVGQQLQLQLQVGEGAGVQQLAQLLRAEQVAQEVLVQRQRGGTALRQGCVALVHVGGDPVEQQALGERGRLRGVHLHHPHLAVAQLGEHLAQGRQVEHVLQAFPAGLQQHREGGVLAGHGEQVVGPLALLPQRGALVRPAAGQQQAACRALAEPGGEQRCLRQGLHHQVVDLVGVDDEVLQRQVVGGLGQTQDDAVVGPHHLHRHVEPVAQTALDGHRPRGVHRRAERAQHADPPVADLVAEAFHHDGAVVGHHARGVRLLPEVQQHVGGCEGVQPVVVDQAAQRLLRRHGAHLPLERAECPAELQRAAGPVAVPERHLPRLAGCRRHDDPFERDVLDPPGAGAEQERLARAALVHHLLVQLADTRAVRQEHAEQAPVRDGAAAGDGQPLGAVAGAQGAVDAVPHQAGAQLVELVARVAAGQQVEHVAEQFVAELGEAGGAPHGAPDLLHRAVGVHADVGHDLLGQHVQRVAQEAAGLDQPLLHPPGDHGGLQQVPPVLGVDRALAGLAHAVPGAADALQAPADRAGGLHLDDEVHRPHVDAELQAAGGDDGPQLAALQLVLDDHPLVPRQAAVVGLHQFAVRAVGGDPLLLGGFVEPGGQALRQAAAVAEDDGAAVGQHLLEDARVDARPDAGSLGVQRHVGRAALQGLRDDLADGTHVLHRDHDVHLQRLAHPRVDDGDRATAAVGGMAAEEVGDLLQRPLGGAEADPLGALACDLLQPLQAEHQMGAALGGGHGVDLVDDHGVHIDQRVADLAGEHEVEALRRGDQQVRRAATELLTLPAGGVAGAHRHGGLDERNLQPLRRQADAHQRRAQVLLHVERQRPQRADVEHPGTGLRLGRFAGDQPVDAAEERRERLAAAGGRADQRVLPGLDGRPALHLRRRGLRERGREPLPHRRGEPLEHRVVGHRRAGYAGGAREFPCDAAPTRRRPRPTTPPAAVELGAAAQVGARLVDPDDVRCGPSRTRPGGPGARPSRAATPPPPAARGSRRGRGGGRNRPHRG